MESSHTWTGFSGGHYHAASRDIMSLERVRYVFSPCATACFSFHAMYQILGSAGHAPLPLFIFYLGAIFDFDSHP